MAQRPLPSPSTFSLSSNISASSSSSQTQLQSWSPQPGQHRECPAASASPVSCNPRRCAPDLLAPTPSAWKFTTPFVPARPDRAVVARCGGRDGEEERCAMRRPRWGRRGKEEKQRGVVAAEMVVRRRTAALLALLHARHSRQWLLHEDQRTRWR